MQTNGIVFIEQSVKARAEYDTAGDTSGTVVDVDFELFEADPENHIFTGVLEVSSNIEESTNLPFEFKLQSFITVVLEESECDADNMNLIRRMVFQMLGASTRERLASITARAPYDTFHLGPMPYSLIEKDKAPKKSKE